MCGVTTALADQRPKPSSPSRVAGASLTRACLFSSNTSPFGGHIRVVKPPLGQLLPRRRPVFARSSPLLRRSPRTAHCCLPTGHFVPTERPPIAPRTLIAPKGELWLCIGHSAAFTRLFAGLPPKAVTAKRPRPARRLCLSRSQVTASWPRSDHSSRHHLTPERDRRQSTASPARQRGRRSDS